MSLGALTDPQPSDFMKDFPALNEVNCNLIDDFAGPCLNTAPLQTYVPTLRGSTTDPVAGSDGINRGFVYQIFDQIYVWGEFRFGTTGFSIGSGDYYFGLPFSTDALINGSTTPARSHPLGRCYIQDQSASINSKVAMVQLATKTEVQFQIKTNSGLSNLVVGSNSPFLLASLDGFLWHAKYKRAS